MLGVLGDQAAEEVDCSDLLANSQFISEHLQGVVVGPGCWEEALASTDFIREILGDLPGLKSVGVIVDWFATSKDVRSLELRPGVEKTRAETGREWVVSDYGRDTAHQLRRSDPADPSTVRFGGTIPDGDVVGCFKALKDQGLQTAFYPFIMVDDEDASWRGFITGEARDVSNFYYQQYRPFIMHYARLFHEHNVEVDIFYLGSELEGLNSIKGEGRDFPFSHCLAELAEEVRWELGMNVKISYAANWTEYHSCRQGGHRPLDVLWSNANINFVGIDYYMPLTDKQVDEDITLEEIKAGFTSGEGFDYYLDADGNRVIIDEPHNRWKDLKTWHETEHWAFDPETSESYKTGWSPGSKPIVFSEFGFPSIDKATNQPYMFGDSLPKVSSGAEDIPLQMRAIKATIEHIMGEGDYISGGFAYCWDSRGKGWQEKFVDGNQWATGHWIDGKIVKEDV